MLWRMRVHCRPSRRGAKGRVPTGDGWTIREEQRFSAVLQAPEMQGLPVGDGCKETDAKWPAMPLRRLVDCHLRTASGRSINSTQLNSTQLRSMLTSVRRRVVSRAASKQAVELSGRGGVAVLEKRSGPFRYPAAFKHRCGVLADARRGNKAPAASALRRRPSPKDSEELVRRGRA